MGSPAFAVPALEAVRARHDVALVVTQPDRPAGRGKRTSPPPVKVAAERAGIPVMQPRATKKAAFPEALRETSADLGVVVAYGRILTRAALSAFPRGCLNIHASLLPEYRGAAPIPRAIRAGERETGVTIMRLDEGMDTGPILAARREPIRDDDTAASLSERLSALGAELLVEVMADVEAGRAAETPQDEAAATYAPPLSKAEGAIEWSRPAREVRDHIRAMDPWPGAVAALRGEVVALFSPRLAEAAEAGDAAGAAPGEILGARRELVIACGEGAIAVGEVRPPGKRRMPAGDFARGRALGPGERFGSPRGE